MKPRYLTSQFAIFDDVLSPEAFHAFWRMFLNSRLKTIHEGGVRAYYRPSDGTPYTGDDVAWTAVPIEPLLPPGVTLASLPARFYPTGTPLDAVIEALQRAIPSCAEVIGRAGQDWIGTQGRIFAYPPGASISWHSDDSDCTGAFIYYGSPRWEAHWGGELLIADPSTHGQLTRQSVHDFDNDHESEVLLRRGYGRYIMPRPNRLVFIGEGNPHMVAKVAPSAGDHVRASFAGFFMTAQGAQRQLQLRR